MNEGKNTIKTIFVGVISLQLFPEQQVMPKSSNVLILYIFTTVEIKFRSHKNMMSYRMEFFCYKKDGW